MKLNKYSQTKEGGTVIGSHADRTSSAPSSSSSTSSSVSSGRELWGNEDNGEDIDGSMTVNGNVFIGGVEFDDDENMIPPEHEFPEAEGCLYAENSIETGGDMTAGGNIKGKDISLSGNGDIAGDLSVKGNASAKEVYGKTLFLDMEGKKTDVLDILKDHDKRISDNATNIKTLQTNVSNCHNQCETNASDIDSLEKRIDALENVEIEADYDSPVILFSGLIQSNNNEPSGTYQPWSVRPAMYSQHSSVAEIKLAYLEVSGAKKPVLVVDVSAKSGWSVKPTSVHFSVSLDQHWNPAVDFGGNRRAQGYWTTGGVSSDGKIYLSVWRTDDSNNDSTTNDCIAFNVQEINLTVFGTARKA